MKEWNSLLTDLRKAVPISIPMNYHQQGEATTASHTLYGFWKTFLMITINSVLYWICILFSNDGLF